MRYDKKKRTMTFESTGKVIAYITDDPFPEPSEPSIVVYSNSGTKVVRVNHAEVIEFADDQIAMWGEWKKQFA